MLYAWTLSDFASMLILSSVSDDSDGIYVPSGEVILRTVTVATNGYDSTKLDFAQTTDEYM